MNAKFLFHRAAWVSLPRHLAPILVYGALMAFQIYVAWKTGQPLPTIHIPLPV
jgi:hypothetical protein